MRCLYPGRRGGVKSGGGGSVGDGGGGLILMIEGVRMDNICRKHGCAADAVRISQFRDNGIALCVEHSNELARKLNAIAKDYRPRSN